MGGGKGTRRWDSSNPIDPLSKQSSSILSIGVPPKISFGENGKGKIHWFKYIVHRIIRILIFWVSCIAQVSSLIKIPSQKLIPNFFLNLFKRINFFFLKGFILFPLARFLLCLPSWHLCEKQKATHSSILAWRRPWTERSLAGYSPWSHKESDTTEWLTLTLIYFFLSPQSPSSSCHLVLFLQCKVTVPCSTVESFDGFLFQGSVFIPQRIQSIY